VPPWPDVFDEEGLKVRNLTAIDRDSQIYGQPRAAALARRIVCPKGVMIG